MSCRNQQGSNEFGKTIKLKKYNVYKNKLKQWCEIKQIAR